MSATSTRLVRVRGANGVATGGTNELSAGAKDAGTAARADGGGWLRIAPAGTGIDPGGGGRVGRGSDEPIGAGKLETG
jgi:hypothetical protein